MARVNYSSVKPIHPVDVWLRRLSSCTSALLPLHCKSNNRIWYSLLESQVACFKLPIHNSLYNFFITLSELNLKGHVSFSRVFVSGLCVSRNSLGLRVCKLTYPHFRAKREKNCNSNEAWTTLCYKLTAVEIQRLDGCWHKLTNWLMIHQSSLHYLSSLIHSFAPSFIRQAHGITTAHQ